MSTRMSKSLDPSIPISIESRRATARVRGRRFVAALCCASILSFSGCQWLGVRTGDGLERLGADDDWALPQQNTTSQVPRPNVGLPRKVTDRISDSAPGSIGTKSQASNETSVSNEVAAKKVAERASLSDSKESSSSTLSQNSPVETNSKELDIDGALEGLPPAYRDLLKRQLAAVQNYENQKGTPNSLATQNGVSNQNGVVEGASATNNNHLTAGGPSAKKTNNAPVQLKFSDAESSSASAPVAEIELAAMSPGSSTNTSVQLAGNQVSTPASNGPSNVSPVVNAGTVPATLASATKSLPIPPLPGSLPVPGSDTATKPSAAQAVMPLPAIPPSNQPTTAEIPNATMQSASAGSALPQQWNQPVFQAIELLEKQIKEQSLADDNLRLHQELVLRMLYVSVRKLDEALRPIDWLSPHEQEYYHHQIMAMFEASNPDAMPVRSRHLSLVMNSQREATNHLAAVSNLEVRSTAFCTEVERYGVITKFPKYQFVPDQEVLLYCELENVAAERVRDAFETQLQGSYEIVDSQGRRISEQILPMEPDVCHNHRRDYFIVYKIYMPQQIAPGSYKLRLTVEDLKARKFGQSTVDFQIKK